MKRPTSMHFVVLATTLLVALALLVCGVALRARGSETTNSQARQEQTLATHGSTEGDEENATSSQTDGGTTETQSGDASDAASGNQDGPLFVMPEGARYEPQMVVVALPDGMTEAELQDVLAAMPHARIVQNEDGLALIEVDEAVSVEDAVNQLLATGEFDEVQPNYIYTALEEGGAAALAEALDTYETQAWEQTGEVVDDVIDAQDNADGSDEQDDAPNEGGTMEQVDSAESNVGTAGDEPADTLAEGTDPEPEDPSQLRERLEVDDPLAPHQYHLTNLHAYEAWALARAERDASGAPVTAAVIDTGFYASHEDLADNVVLTYDAVNGDADVQNGSYSGHGTHVAGVLSARTNNELGVAGVSYNAQLVLVLVANGSGEASSYTIAHSYDYLLERRDELNLRVVNISLGAPYQSSAYQSQDKLVMKKVDEAYAAGVVTVAAAGNRSNNVKPPCAMFPCDLNHVVSVINVNQAHKRVDSSNYNRPGERTKNISAPGNAIVSTNGTDTVVVFDEITYRGYTSKGGTSFAAPCVSAVLALEFSANPSLTADEAIDVLYGTADDIGDEGWDEQTGYGEAIAYNAVLGATGAKISGPQSAVVGDVGIAFAVTSDAEGTWLFDTSDPQVLSIDAKTGIAKASAAGTATVTATNEDGASVARVVQVFGGISGEETVACGTSPTYAVEGDETILQSWKWSSSDKTVATIGADTGLMMPIHAGTVTVTVTSVSDPTFTMSKVVKVTGVAGQAMLRLYNPNSGEHFYTASKTEFDTLVSLGWIGEGIGWYSPEKSTTPVYRMYNPNEGDHHYTVSVDERDALVSYGWRYEGMGWYSDDSHRVPVRREYNPNEYSCNHNYTTSKVEHDTLINLGWNDEGIGWYALAAGDAA